MRVEGLGQGSERRVLDISVEGMDAAGRFTEVLKGLDSRGAGCYHARRRQGERGMSLSRVDMGNPGLERVGGYPQTPSIRLWRTPLMESPFSGFMVVCATGHVVFSRK